MYVQIKKQGVLVRYKTYLLHKKSATLVSWLLRYELLKVDVFSAEDRRISRVIEAMATLEGNGDSRLLVLFKK